MQFSEIKDKKTVDEVTQNLSKNGITPYVVETIEDAKKKVLEILPEKAEVMTMTSETLRESGISDAINSSSRYVSVRKKLESMNRETDSLEMQKLGSAPEWTIGSVHAITRDGSIYIASNTGSQLPAYVYGSPHVIWVAGTQKIVENHDEAMKRIYEYILPLESERAKKAYNLPESWHSNPSKILIINKEVSEGRIHLIFVNQKAGF